MPRLGECSGSERGAAARALRPFFNPIRKRDRHRILAVGMDMSAALEGEVRCRWRFKTARPRRLTTSSRSSNASLMATGMRSILPQDPRGFPRESGKNQKKDARKKPFIKYST
jgi:hypothetical protein